MTAQGGLLTAAGPVRPQRAQGQQQVATVPLPPSPWHLPPCPWSGAGPAPGDPPCHKPGFTHRAGGRPAPEGTSRCLPSHTCPWHASSMPFKVSQGTSCPRPELPPIPGCHKHPAPQHFKRCASSAMLRAAGWASPHLPFHAGFSGPFSLHSCCSIRPRGAHTAGRGAPPDGPSPAVWPQEKPGGCGSRLCVRAPGHGGEWHTSGAEVCVAALRVRWLRQASRGRAQHGGSIPRAHERGSSQRESRLGVGMNSRESRPSPQGSPPSMGDNEGTAGGETRPCA